MRWASTSIRRDSFEILQADYGNRNDQIAAHAFGAERHFPPTAFEDLKSFDAVFVTMWKVFDPAVESRWLEIVHRLKDAGKVVVLFQEAELQWPMARPWDEMKSFLEAVRKVDLYLTHNQREVELWRALRIGKPIYRWKTCLDLLPRTRSAIPPEEKPTQPILIGSSYNERGNGLTALIACSTFRNPIWHHDRSPDYVERNADLPRLLNIEIQNEIPCIGWYDWTRRIAGAYVAVHLLAAAAAGRDQVTLAALGIPCIGNERLDMQNDLFPDLGVDIYDIEGIRALVKRLIQNETFYNGSRQYALRHVESLGLDGAKTQAESIMREVGWI